MITRRLAMAVVAALMTLSACTLLGDSEPPPESPADSIDTGRATMLLRNLEVKPATPMHGYDRDHFGDWLDLDHNGCDTRTDVLKRDAEMVVTAPSDPCEVVTIRLIDPYGAGDLTSPSDIDIDHVVPLAAAWRSGAARWGQRTLLEEFANDRGNLLAVDDGRNQSKGDQTPDEWMPPERFRCAYVKLYIDVSFRYHLTVTESTMDTLTTALSDYCEE